LAVKKERDVRLKVKKNRWRWQLQEKEDGEWNFFDRV
jgi:hypothetical protein